MAVVVAVRGRVGTDCVVLGILFIWSKLPATLTLLTAVDGANGTTWLHCLLMQLNLFVLCLDSESSISDCGKISFGTEFVHRCDECPGLLICNVITCCFNCFFGEVGFFLAFEAIVSVLCKHSKISSWGSSFSCPLYMCGCCWHCSSYFINRFKSATVIVRKGC